MAEPTRILAIRHGRTAWNADGRIQGHQDIALDALGRWQAQRLALALAEEDLQAIYSSDLQRARDTAAPLQRQHGLELVIDAGLRERAFGEFEGHSFAQIEQRWPEQAARWRRRDDTFEPRGGESLRDLRRRIVAAVDRLASRHRGQHIVLLTHGGALDVLYRHATGLSLQAPRSWQVDNAAINRLMHTDETLVLIGWADVGHLEATASPQSLADLGEASPASPSV